MPRYTVNASTATISAPSCSATRSATADLPTPVGPTIARIRSAMRDEVADPAWSGVVADPEGAAERGPGHDHRRPAKRGDASGLARTQPGKGGDRKSTRL